MDSYCPVRQSRQAASNALALALAAATGDHPTGDVWLGDGRLAAELVALAAKAHAVGVLRRLAALLHRLPFAGLRSIVRTRATLSSGARPALTKPRAAVLCEACVEDITSDIERARGPGASPRARGAVVPVWDGIVPLPLGRYGRREP